ncbi:hypothetical protein O7599_13480 [Streptomyces sp. WMMC500]|uniref:hypothetical protein n=1 Tax=Streptomyces sp. WMMC500 TaxID=3015154 RepID=UPI00248C0CE9|nr:hypothetical protein [Streptomyces sp. WMMC500]WBB63466.1 hypothetical protein O7599_13480 [Streptomyces sp. WMMC500]
MNAILEYTVGTLVLIFMAAILVGPALYFDRRERTAERRLKAAERGEKTAPAGDVSARDALAGYGRAA